MLELRTPADVSLVELRRLASAKTRGVPVGGTAAGIRAMAIVPGTPFTDILSKEARAGVAAAVPSPSRLGRPAEYASLLREIVRNSMLNGVTIRLDGALRLTTRRRDVPTVSHETAGTGPSFRPPARF